MIHTPDAWIVIKVSGTGVPGGPLYKILGGWYGGYGGADTWRLNSGIEKITDKEDHYLVEGYSGSVYQCYKHCEHQTGLMSSILLNVQEKSKYVDVVVDVIDMSATISEMES